MKTPICPFCNRKTSLSTPTSSYSKSYRCALKSCEFYPYYGFYVSYHDEKLRYAYMVVSHKDKPYKLTINANANYTSLDELLRHSDILGNTSYEYYPCKIIRIERALPLDLSRGRAAATEIIEKLLKLNLFS